MCQLAAISPIQRSIPSSSKSSPICERLENGARRRTARTWSSLGDFNVAPLETDVWSHKQLLKVVSHTPIEVDHLERVMNAGPWVDIIRRFVPANEKLYSWWSYRARDWELSDRGRRLDHIWGTGPIASRAKGMTILKEARGWPGPSDHVPVIADFEF